MDYWTRLILASIVGIGAGLGISYFFGDPVFWSFLCLAIAIATETSLRTIKNVKAPVNPLLEKTPKISQEINQLPRTKPPKPNF
ncbi:MAG: hypothetical protein WCX08_04895 [Candidatus Buchananbacteria bacterium]|jgi:hypothetical protein